MHPGTPWLKCGEAGCKNRDFSYHAICHGVRVSKQDVKSFCQKYIRCSKHVKQNIDYSALTKDFISTSSSESEDVFETSKSKRRKLSSVKARKNSASKVSTPGNYTLESVGDKIRPVFDKNNSSVFRVNNVNKKNSVYTSDISTTYRLSEASANRVKPSFSGSKSKINYHRSQIVIPLRVIDL